MLLAESMNIRILLFPEGHDPDSFARENSMEFVKNFIKENSKDFIDFKAEILLKEAENDPIKKAEAIRDIVKSVAHVDNGLKQEIYLKQIATQFGLTERNLFDELQVQKQILKGQSQSQPKPKLEIVPKTEEKPFADSDKTTGLLVLEEKLVELMLKYGDRILTRRDSENNSYQTTVIDVEEISLKGKHNIKNTMAAAVAARLVNIRNASLRESLKGFQGAAHRLEEVKVVEGVTYINDSKATNVNSVYFALDTIKTPIVWIVGGQDKGNDYNSLLPYVHQKVKAIVCLGVDNTPILQSFYNVIDNMVETRSMEEAVKMAQRFATAGDTVLLSPACASFDLFKSYEDRGNQFKAAVAKL